MCTPITRDACAAVEADLSKPWSVQSLPVLVNTTSERTVSRLYRTEFGMTYPQWRTRVRLFAAMVMLAVGASVTDTATSTGWATISAFVDAFTRALGETPSAFRTPQR